MFSDLKDKKLIFVNGKGGVGKTSLSWGLARTLSSVYRKRVLWTCFENQSRPLGQLETHSPGLDQLNCETLASFEEYATQKIGVPALSKIFVRNRLVNFLANASPGIRELVMMGKVWNERQNYDIVVADMPSTGYGIAMYYSTHNFSRLFRGGPIQKDATAMMETFSNPALSSHLIVSIPEEVPLQESLEMHAELQPLLSQNPPQFIVNRCFPEIPNDAVLERSEKTRPPESLVEFAYRRSYLERSHLNGWEQAGIQYLQIPTFFGEHLDQQWIDYLKEQINGS